jgi:parallel beta-helix repeat protein
MQKEAEITFTVAPDGQDGNPGTEAQPFATLERAREAIRHLKETGGLPVGGVRVELRRGIYELAQPFALTADDSGRPDAPVTYCARAGEEVRLSGGRRLAGWELVTEPGELERLDPAARGQVWRADLRANGVTDFGVVATNQIKNTKFPVASENRLELFFQDRPMTLARWPNDGFARIAKTVGGDCREEHGRTFDRIGRFTCDDARLERWAHEREVWVHGYWAWEWAEQRQPVERIDAASRTLDIAPPYHSYGYRAGQPFYAFNLLCELDMPGEWYLDRERGLLYFWPPESLEHNAAVVSVIPTLVSMQGASHVSLRGLALEACRGNAVEAADVTQVWVEDCVIRNTGDYAVNLTGAESGVRRCDIHGTGSGGIWLSGGDRATLTPGNLRVEDNEIHHYSRWHRAYKPGVLLGGVRNHVIHNRIHDAPHFGIWFHGNDHFIEFNEFHHLSMETSDTGAVYAGADIVSLGNVIQHNYFHDLGSRDEKLPLVAGIYLDDGMGGVLVRGNVFVGTTWAGVCINGGADNVIENNLFLRCQSAVRGNNGSPEAFRSAKKSVLQLALDAVPYTESPWRERYPELVERMREWGEPWRAINNRVERNICIDSPWEMNTGLYRFRDNWGMHPGQTPESRLLSNPDDPRRDGFALDPSSPARNRGFQPLLFARMGPRRDGERTEA